MHGVHHQWPHDKLRLVFPPGASIPLYFSFLTLFLLTLRSYGWGFHAGFRYMGFVDENLQGMQEFNAPGESESSSSQVYGGISIFF